jgi:hypothetical protein
MCTELRLTLVPDIQHSEIHVQWTLLPAMTGHLPSKRKISKFLSEPPSGLSHSNYPKRFIVDYIGWHKECSCWRQYHRDNTSFLLCKALSTACDIARKFLAGNSSPLPPTVRPVLRYGTWKKGSVSCGWNRGSFGSRTQRFISSKEVQAFSGAHWTSFRPVATGVQVAAMHALGICKM